MTKKSRSVVAPADESGILPGELSEFGRLLSKVAIATNDGQRKLQLDLVRDEVVEAMTKAHELYDQIRQKLERTREKRATLQQRHLDLLHHLACGPTRFASTRDLNPEEISALTSRYETLRKTTFPTLAEKLQKLAAVSESKLIHALLADEILLKGSWFVVEHLARQLSFSEPLDDHAFLGEFANHVSASVNQGLLRLTDYQVSPEVNAKLAKLYGEVGQFLLDLHRANPAIRLILPVREDLFNPEIHERLSGRPARHVREVRSVMFPGLLIYEPAVRVLAKAIVHTERVANQATPQPLGEGG